VEHDGMADFALVSDLQRSLPFRFCCPLHYDFIF